MEPPTLEQVRDRWSKYAPLFAETSNKRITLQCARELNAHLELSEARSVLEVGAGPGLGSLDILKRMLSGGDANRDEKKLVATDLSPAMVAMARETLASAASEAVDVQVMEANGEALSGIATASVDRLVSNLCLQLTPDPDAMLRETNRVLTPAGLAGFTIWGKPEHSAKHSLFAAVSRELGLVHGWDTRSFDLGRDLPALRTRFAAAGFSRVRMWPFLCVLELWSGEAFAEFFFQQRVDKADADLFVKAFELATRLADEYLAQGFPIGLETYIILARV